MRKTFNKTPLKIGVLICFGCYARAKEDMHRATRQTPMGLAHLYIISGVTLPNFIKRKHPRKEEKNKQGVT